MLPESGFWYKRIRIKSRIYPALLVIMVKLLIRQIRSFGSLSKGIGEHAPHLFNHKFNVISFLLYLWSRIGVGWPKVTFKAPTYLTGGSNLSSTPQGGYYKKKDFKETLIMILTFGRITLKSKMSYSPLHHGDLQDKNF